MGDIVIEHGESRRARTLRQKRLRTALAVAAIEGILVLVGAIPWWLVVVLATGAVALYVALRDSDHHELRQLAWVAAFSQLVLVLVPVAAAIVTALAVVLVVGFALVALVALLRDRR